MTFSLEMLAILTSLRFCVLVENYPVIMPHTTLHWISLVAKLVVSWLIDFNIISAKSWPQVFPAFHQYKARALNALLSILDWKAGSPRMEFPDLLVSFHGLTKVIATGFIPISSLIIASLLWLYKKAASGWGRI